MRASFANRCTQNIQISETYKKSGMFRKISINILDQQAEFGIIGQPERSRSRETRTKDLQKQQAQ